MRAYARIPVFCPELAEGSDTLSKFRDFLKLAELIDRRDAMLDGKADQARQITYTQFSH